MKIAIYGLFDLSSGECLYVGKTRNPWSRERCHKAKGLLTPSRIFKTLRWVGVKRANDHERAAILDFKSKGQAVFNKNIPEPSLCGSDFEIGFRLKSIREQKGVKQNFIANKLGITNNYLSELEAGKKRWFAAMVLRYEKILGINN